MADRIQIYAGKKADMPELLPRELGFCTDSGELYIGTSAGNKLVGCVKWAEDISTLKTSLSEKLSASPATHIVSLDANATLETAVSAINQILANMIAAGLMMEPI